MNDYEDVKGSSTDMFDKPNDKFAWTEIASWAAEASWSRRAFFWMLALVGWCLFLLVPLLLVVSLLFGVVWLAKEVF